MAVSLDETISPPTREEIQEIIYSVIGTVGVSTTNWKPGAVVRTIIAALAIVLYAAFQLQALIARSGFLDLATGVWLTLVARYVYGVERIEATFATGTVTLDNAGGGVYAFDPDDLIFSNPDTGKTYRNVEAVSIGALETGIEVLVRAVEAGSTSTSLAGTIVEMVTAVLGVSCTNETAVIGQDEELDPALRTRCRVKLGSLSPMGPPDAYEYAARNATLTDGTPAGVTRTKDNRDGFGNFYLYCATDSGELEGTIGDLTTPLGAVDDAVQRRAAPLAVTAHTLSSTPVEVNIVYEAWAYNTSGLTSAQFQAAIAAKLVTFVRTEPIGGHEISPDPGKLFVETIRDTIRTARAELFHVVVTSPAADVEFEIYEVPVLGTVTCTAIHLQRPPSGGV
jgi:hypothetical protein